MTWSALHVASAAATAHALAQRLPFFVDGAAVGSIDRKHLSALRRYPQWLDLRADAVVLHIDMSERNTALEVMNTALRDQGLVRAWRRETFPLLNPGTGAVLALMERAAMRFWGALTLGAHATGFLADAAGNATHLWIAQRSPHKAIDPGLFDNLIGGGVAVGQTPLQALVREGWEEAGLSSAQMQRAVPGRVVRVMRPVAEGFQNERLHSFDLRLEPGEQPVNQDGEVANFQLLPVAPALALAATQAMTVDASLVTLEFALRHRLLPAWEMRGAERQLGASLLGLDRLAASVPFAHSS